MTLHLFDCRWKKVAWLLALSVTAGIAAHPRRVSEILLALTASSDADGGLSQNPADYEWVIDCLRGKNLKTGERHLYRLAQQEKSLIPQAKFNSLQESATGLLSAMRTEDGRLIVLIITNDQHHAGVYGLIHSSGKLAPEEMRFLFGAGLMPDSKRIDEHWWRVVDQSN